jgi:hypothetical protein
VTAHLPAPRVAAGFSGFKQKKGTESFFSSYSLNFKLPIAARCLDLEGRLGHELWRLEEFQLSSLLLTVKANSVYLVSRQFESPTSAYHNIHWLK